MIKEETIRKTFLQIHPADNVLVALTDLPISTLVSFNGNEFVLKDNIAAKHKFL